MSSREEIVRLHLAGVQNKDVALRCGCSRQYVGRVLKEHGLTRHQTNEPPKLIDFRPTNPDHREQHAYRMLKLYDKRRAKLPLTEESKKRLDAFLDNTDRRVWTFNETEGFHSKRRQPHHGGDPFVKDA